MSLKMPLLLRVVLYKVKQYRYPLIVAYITLIVKYNILISFFLSFSIPFGFSSPEYLLYFLYALWLFPPDVSIFGINLVVNFNYISILLLLYLGYSIILGFISPSFIILTINAHVKKQLINFREITIQKYLIFLGLYLVVFGLSFFPYFWYFAFVKIFNLIIFGTTFILLVLLSPIIFIFPVLLIRYPVIKSLLLAIKFFKDNSSWLLQYTLLAIITIGTFTFFAIAIGRYSTGLMLLFSFAISYPFVVLLSILLIGRITDKYLLDIPKA